MPDRMSAKDSRRRTPGSEGRPANRSLSAIEPVSAPPKRKLENRQQRPAPETRPTRTERPEIADQRLGHPSLTCGNVGDSPPPGNSTPETGLRGCPSWTLIEPCASRRSLMLGE